MSTIGAMADIVLSKRRPFDYRWTIRGVDPELVRQMRILALRQDRSAQQLVNEALQAYLWAHAEGGV